MYSDTNVAVLLLQYLTNNKHTKHIKHYVRNCSLGDWFVLYQMSRFVIIIIMVVIIFVAIIFVVIIVVIIIWLSTGVMSRCVCLILSLPP